MAKRRALLQTVPHLLVIEHTRSWKSNSLIPPPRRRQTFSALLTQGFPHTASLIAQSVKKLPAMQETRVRFLGWEDPLEKGMTTHSSILAWRIPWIEEPGGLQSTRSQESDTTERLHFHFKLCYSKIFLRYLHWEDSISQY